MTTYDARPSAFTQLTTTADWESFVSTLFPSGGAIDASVGSAMSISLDTGGRNAVIADGNVMIRGQLWRCDAPVSTPIPSASAQDRIDRLVLRLNRTAATSPTVIQPTIITGTPSGSPAVPSIVRTPTGIWDYPVSHRTSASTGALTSLVDDRVFVNDAWRAMSLINNWTMTSANIAHYKRNNNNDLELLAYLNSGASTSSLNICSIPPAYRPSATQYFPISTTGGITPASSTPYGAVTSGGTLFLTGLTVGGSYSIVINAKIPLGPVP